MCKFKIVKSLIKKKNPVIVEVGAHYGEDSVKLLDVCGATVYCFEPDPRNIAIIKQYIGTKIKLYEYAVSNKNGEAEFYQSYNPDVTPKMLKKYSWIDKKDYIKLKLNSSGASSLKSGYRFVSDHITVNTIRLEDWIIKHKILSIDLLWIDVQGAECEVIEGLGKKNECVQYVVMEYGETNNYDGALTREQTIKLMKNNDFILMTKFSSSSDRGDLWFRHE